MRSEDVLDLLDSIDTPGIKRTRKLPLPGLSVEDIQSLRLQGNPVAALAGETTNKEYLQLHKYRNVISHSIVSGLHACPRKFVLEKISANYKSEYLIANEPNIDFVFGHSVGAGIQTFLAFDRNLTYGLYAAFLGWHAKWDFGKEDYLRRKHKTIERAVLAVESFSYFSNTALDEWEIFKLEDERPAVELSFCIDFGGSKYFGHIDLILRNVRTGRIAIGENKTSGYSNPDEASYRNSGQALGYSIVLDSLVGELADYDVLYLVYSATSQEWQCFPFAKSVAKKLEWMQDRLFDMGHIKQYFQMQHFPQDGASCLLFNRRCQFFGQCDLVDKEKMAALPELGGPEEVEVAYPVDFYFKMEDIVKVQMERSTV